MFPYTRLKSLILLPLTLGLATTFLQIMLFGYQSKFWSEQVIFWISDGHCEVPEGIGSHCFGDFALPYNAVQDPNFYREGNIALTTNPPMVLVFKILQLLPFRLALSIFLICSVLAIYLPFLSRLSQLDLPTKVIWATISGLLSIGSLAAIDRGNNVIFVVPLLFLLIVALERSRWLLAVIAIALIATLKIWAVLFIIGLIAKKKFRYAGLAIVLSGLVNLLSIVFLHLQGSPQSLLAKIQYTLNELFNREYADFVSAYSISFSGLAKRFACIAKNEGACNFVEISQSPVGSTFLKLLLLVVCLVIVALLLRTKGIPPFIGMTALSGLGIVAVPDAAIYNASLAISGLAAILALHVNNNNEDRHIVANHWHLLTALPIMTSLLSFTLIAKGNWSSSILVGTTTWWRSYFFLIPLSWLVFFVGCGVLLIRQLLLNRQQRLFISLDDKAQQE